MHAKYPFLFNQLLSSFKQRKGKELRNNFCSEQVRYNYCKLSSAIMKFTTVTVRMADIVLIKGNLQNLLRDGSSSKTVLNLFV